MRYRPGTTSTFSDTIEFDWQGDCLQIEAMIEYAIDEYDPGVRYDRDGGGCPPSGGGVYPGWINVKSAIGDDDHGRSEGVTVRERFVIQKEINRLIDLPGKNPLRDSIQSACDTDAYDRWDRHRDDLAEAHHEARQRFADWHGSVAEVS